MFSVRALAKRVERRFSFLFFRWSVLVRRGPCCVTTAPELPAPPTPEVKEEKKKHGKKSYAPTALPFLRPPGASMCERAHEPDPVGKDYLSCAPAGLTGLGHTRKHPFFLSQSPVSG